jgi:hypothetical protein
MVLDTSKLGLIVCLGDTVLSSKKLLWQLPEPDYVL